MPGVIGDGGKEVINMFKFLKFWIFVTKLLFKNIKSDFITFTMLTAGSPKEYEIGQEELSKAQTRIKRRFSAYLAAQRRSRTKEGKFV